MRTRRAFLRAREEGKGTDMEEKIKVTAKQNGAAKSDSAANGHNGTLYDGIGKLIVPSMDAHLQTFTEWAELVQLGTQMMKDNLESVTHGLQEIGVCRDANEIREIGITVSRSLAERLAENSKKIANLSMEFANRRMRANTELARSVFK